MAESRNLREFEFFAVDKSALGGQQKVALARADHPSLVDLPGGYRKEEADKEETVEAARTTRQRGKAH